MISFISFYFQVTHFDRKFEYNKFKAAVEKEGWKKMDEEFTKSKQKTRKKIIKAEFQCRKLCHLDK